MPKTTKIQVDTADIKINYNKHIRTKCPKL